MESNCLIIATTNQCLLVNGYQIDLIINNNYCVRMPFYDIFEIVFTSIIEYHDILIVIANKIIVLNLADIGSQP